jgi:uncharacterized protein YecE (DUF72 family)
MRWIGTSGFQYPEWKGKFYPENLPARGMLPYYAERFSTTEINYSFRRIPSAQTISNWAGATPQKFRFSFKAPQRITHYARLLNCAEVLEVFGGAVSAMGTKLGPILFQLPPQFKKDFSRLAEFLPTVAGRFRSAFEFRHDSWFDDEVYHLLAAHNAALCIAESEEIETPRVKTADFGYLRLRREDYTLTKLRSWARFVEEQSGWEEAFVYFKHEEQAVGPNFAQQFSELVGQE